MKKKSNKKNDVTLSAIKKVLTRKTVLEIFLEAIIYSLIFFIIITDFNEELVDFLNLIRSGESSALIALVVFFPIVLMISFIATIENKLKK